MILDRKARVTGVAQVNASVGAGHTNGFLIYTDHKEANVTVRFRHKYGQDVLIPNIPLKYLNTLSDFMHGSATSPEGAADLLLGNRFKLDLGSLFVESGEELTIDIVSTSGTITAAVYAVSEARTPHAMVQYETTNDLNVNLSGIQSLFAFHDGNADTDLDNYDVNYKLITSYDTVLFDHLGAYLATSLIGRYEVAPSTKNVCLFVNSTNVPENVQVQVTGSQASKVTLLAIRSLYVQQLTSRSTIAEAEIMANRIGTLEKQAPEVAKALRHANRIQKSGSIRQAISALS